MLTMETPMQFEVNLKTVTALIALFVIVAFAGYGLGRLLGSL